jgi:hypothetical protein
MLEVGLMGLTAKRVVVVLTLVLGTPAGMIIAGATPQASAAAGATPQASAAAGATPQASAACSLDNHCYAIAENLNTATNHGAYGEINAHCLYMPSGNGDFVTNEIWDIDSSRKYWEEVGIFSGVSQGGSGDRNWFWDDDTPAGGYKQHDSSVQANTDTTYRAMIEFAGSDTWNLYGLENFALFGTSEDQSATLISNEGGTEYTAASDSGMRDQGQVGNLQRRSSDDDWFSWGSNAVPFNNGYINAAYAFSSSTVSWTGPC